MGSKFHYIFLKAAALGGICEQLSLVIESQDLILLSHQSNSEVIPLKRAELQWCEITIS